LYSWACAIVAAQIIACSNKCHYPVLLCFVLAVRESVYNCSQGYCVHLGKDLRQCPPMVLLIKSTAANESQPPADGSQEHNEHRPPPLLPDQEAGITLSKSSLDVVVEGLARRIQVSPRSLAATDPPAPEGPGHSGKPSPN